MKNIDNILFIITVIFCIYYIDCILLLLNIYIPLPK